MQHFDHQELGTLNHAAEVMGDRIAHEPDDYDQTASSAVGKLDSISPDHGTSVLALTGAELNGMDASHLFRRIVETEIDNWVPNASQRLLYRAARALDNSGSPRFNTGVPECGHNTYDHATVPDWIEGLYVLRCVVCGRMYRR